MSKRMYKKGKRIESIDEFFQHERFIVNGKVYHYGWCMGWPMRLAKIYIDSGLAFVAEKKECVK